MPALKNGRQELYAQARAAGKSQVAAGIMAGYTGKDGNMSVLERRPHVFARIEELRAEALTVETERRDTYLTAIHFDFVDRGSNLKWVMHEWRLLMRRAERTGDTKLWLRCMEWITAGLGFVSPRAPGLAPQAGPNGPKKAAGTAQRAKEAQEDHKNEQSRRTEQLTEDEISDLDLDVELLGDGVGDESEAADAPAAGLVSEVPASDGGDAGGEDGHDGPDGSDAGAGRSPGQTRDPLPQPAA